MNAPGSPPAFGVVLFPSVGHALRAEKLVKAEGIPCRMIPVPRHLSSDCGVCMRFPWDQHSAVAELLRDRVDHLEIFPLAKGESG